MKKQKITGLRYEIAGPRAFWYEMESLARFFQRHGLSLSVAGAPVGAARLGTLAVALAKAKADPIFFSDEMPRRAGMSSRDLAAYLSEMSDENPWD